MSARGLMGPAVWCLGVALGSISGAALAAEETAVTISNSGIQRPEYQSVLQAMRDLVPAYPGWVRVVDYGRSVQGRTLRAVRIQDSTRAQGPGTRPAVLISGSTHGNEYLNVEDRLPEWFLLQRQRRDGVARFLRTGGVIYIVPVVNPDGFSAGTRGNSRGTDLNRDFTVLPSGKVSFREPETRLLAQWLERDLKAAQLKLKLTVDYHCCGRALLFPWQKQAATGATRGNLVKVARMMQEQIEPGYSYGGTSQVLGYATQGTSKDYYAHRYQALAFTFEGEYRTEAAKFERHTLWWDQVLGHVAGL